MKSIATLVSEEAVELLEFLNKEHVPGEIQTHIEKSGLEISEILIEDSNYDAACNAAERWQAGLVAQEAEKKSKMRCPKCGSRHLVPVEDDKFMLMFQCKDCGYQIV
jgi:DNA-directed RNA polymerase subunit RPC12/RpoP